MDEISRELPPDTTTRRGYDERTKGPEELVLADRMVVREDLVVNEGLPADEPAGPAAEVPLARFPALPGPAPEAVPAPEPEPAGESPAELQPDAALATEPDAAVAGEVLAGSLPVDAPEAPMVEATLPPDLQVDGAESIDAAAAAAAVAEEAEVAEIAEELASEEEGLPPVPELRDAAEVAKIVYVLMLSSREALSLLRLAQACNTTQKLVEQALDVLQANLRSLGLPVELCRTGDTVKWMSGVEAFPYLQRLRGVKKLEKLSPAALETLAVIAYRQPVMRSEIEAVRGVKAGPMLRTLLQHKLVCTTGRAEVPGRPLQYGTTQQFLERFGLSSLQALPSLREWKNLG